MSRPGRVLLAVVLLLAAAGLLWLVRGGDAPPSGDEASPHREEEVLDAAAVDVRARVSTPRPNAVVASPVEVSGEARGAWFFEADFPVRLLDAGGRELAAVPATAKGEWMTEAFVPFEAAVAFEQPATDAGLLVLDRADPSGLADNAAMVVVPVRFRASAPRTRAVRIFFNRRSSGDDACDAVWPVARAVEPARAEAEATLAELLAGPTRAEESRGYLTNIPEGVRLRSLRVEDGTAYADFDATLDRAAGSCRVLAIRAQIERTLLRLPGIEDVVISVEGEVEEALQP